MRHRQLVEMAERAAIQPMLVNDLVCLGRAQLGRSVSGQHQQRTPGLVGLGDRRMQVCRRGAGSAHHRDGLGAASGKAKCEEAGGSLVDSDV